nr:MAG: hypothetical protein E4H34_01260 [Hyphomicrobiales bacterium]
MYSKTLGIAGLALSLFAIPAFGHHSYAMFNNTQLLNLKGTVTDFEWVNPHSWLHVSITNESGTAETLSFASSSPRGLMAEGWKADSVGAGDAVEIEFHPLRDGSRGGQLLVVSRSDGTKLCADGDYCGLTH